MPIFRQATWLLGVAFVSGLAMALSFARAVTARSEDRTWRGRVRARGQVRNLLCSRWECLREGPDTLKSSESAQPGSSPSVRKLLAGVAAVAAARVGSAIASIFWLCSCAKSPHQLARGHLLGVDAPAMSVPFRWVRTRVRQWVAKLRRVRRNCLWWLCCCCGYAISWLGGGRKRLRPSLYR
jgi:hypothetical protein